MLWLLKKPGIKLSRKDPILSGRLSTESVQSTALSLQSVHNVHGSDRLSLGVLCVRNGITDDVLEEDFEDAASLLIDEARDTLHSATTCKTTDGRFGDSLDVVAENLTMTLGATLSETLASFATTRHTEQNTS